MAVEVAQYLQNQFLTSLEEAESELSGSVNLVSYFKEIKDILEEGREVISFPMGGCSRVSPLLSFPAQLCLG
ncbi:hypothetical protein M0R45_004789 [Rubus argutus]|uniref:Uncharacterized protein n=1 Tax=Rubus argutus TaxID=59490 RepID=A0AAW1YKX6_RUBAR